MNETEVEKLTDRNVRFFETEHLKSDLKGRSVRGGAVTMAAQGAKFSLQMGSTIVLARLLTPQDYGLIAMVIAVTGFVAMFKDLGLSMATVQKAEINHGQISTLFWINVGLSLCVMVVIAAMAPVITWFYSEPRLTWITLALASAFIFGGLTVQHQALLRRQMRFGALALIQISSMATGIVTAIIAAWYGAGYWALVLMELAEVITATIGVWFACPWRPGLPVRRSGVRPMLAFGGNLTGFSVLNYFARNLDNILIGWYWGAALLGLYSKAYGLLMLPIRQINAPISAVAVPTLSRLQNEPERLRVYYRKGLMVVASFSVPMVVFCCVAARDLVLLVLGRGWLEVVTIFRLLAVGALMGAVAGPSSGWVFLALGNVSRQLKLALFQVASLVVGFAAGLRWGPEGVAAAFSIHQLAWRVPTVAVAFWRTPLKLTDFFGETWRPTVASIVAGGVSYLLYMKLEPATELILRLVTEFVAFYLCYILINFSLPGGRTRALSGLGLLRHLYVRRRPSRVVPTSV